MKSAHLRFAIPAAAVAGIAAVPASAQRPPSTEQRVAVVEQQLATSQAANVRLQQRLDSIERQLQQLINRGEINGHRIDQFDSALSKLRTDVESRLTALESSPAPVQERASQAADVQPAPVPPKTSTAAASPSASEDSATSAEPSTDPGEDAYSAGYHLWRDGRYDQAITALKTFISSYPDHRRVSFARNLIGRALLDKGDPRAAAEALLANYRSDPKGERAPDSLYYLGQALMKLSQPGQACKAYGELEDVYGTSVRPDLSSLVNQGKADAHCS